MCVCVCVCVCVCEVAYASVKEIRMGLRGSVRGWGDSEVTMPLSLGTLVKPYVHASSLYMCEELHETLGEPRRLPNFLHNDVRKVFRASAQQFVCVRRAPRYPGGIWAS